MIAGGNPSQKAGELVESGHHCAEAALQAVGEYFLGPLTDREKRLATGFSGGIGGTELDNCGVFSVGVLIISALYGRSSPEEDDEECQMLVKRFRDRFIVELGTINCGKLRSSGYGSAADDPCSVLVERATRLLVEEIQEFQAGTGG
jgi:C_GCAxxG_C_C family probable redox protein